MSGNDRSADMARRLADTATKHGLSSGDRDVIVRAYGSAMDVRAEKIDDDHHPAFLHPGRTALVLMDDVGVRDANIIAAACLLDSEHPELRVQLERVSAEPRAILMEIPVPDLSGDELLERLLSAENPVQLIALAERLDYARHLHLTPADGWRGFHSMAREVYLPVAGRAHLLLERRLRWWCDMFDRLFLTLAHGR